MFLGLLAFVTWPINLLQKVISNLLKIFLLSNLLSLSRLISNKTIMTFELFHAIKGDNSLGRAMVKKPDLAKAYDRVEWFFLARAILRLGFPSSWVKLVMRCVWSGSFSFLVNGILRGNVVSS